MTKQLKDAIKNLSYYGKIAGKGRYSGIKAKAWAITSDFVRIRDFIFHGGFCVTCGNKIPSWKDGQAGHYISMGGHGALIGFCLDNIHLQCSQCNHQSSFHLGINFKENIEARGIDTNELEHLKNQSIKADDWYFLGIITNVYDKFLNLKNKYPDLEYPNYL